MDRLFLICVLAIAIILPIASGQCPNKPGYVARADLNWGGSDKTKESQTNPAANAEKVCNLDANCLAFNNFGYYILKKGEVAPTIAAAGITFSPYKGMCTYVKQSAVPCPDKAGYVTREFTNWEGSDKTKESQTSPPENAEKICNLDANCLAFNSFGYYILKKSEVPMSLSAAGVSFSPYEKICTYVKTALSTPSQKPTPSVPSQTATPSQKPTPSQPKTFVFRNSASRQCFGVNENVRLPVGGLPRLLSTTCSAADKSQGFKVVSVGNLYNIIDSQGRCLTSYSGLLIESAGFMRCAPNRADQLWALNSTTPNGKGPYLIQSKDENTCLAIERGAVALEACNARDTTMLFESAFL